MSGKPEIEHDQLRPALRGDPQRVAAGSGDLDLVPARLQQGADGALNRHFVVDEKNAGCSCHMSCSTAGCRPRVGGDDNGEPRPAVGAILDRNAAVFGREQSAGDRQSHPGPGRPDRGFRPAVEPLEDVRQVLRRHPGAPIAHAQGQAVSRHDGSDLHRAARRRVLRRVLDDVRQRARRQARIDPHETIRFDIGRERVPVQRVSDLFAGGFDDLRRIDPAEVRADRTGIDARHLQDVLEQAIQAFDFRHDQRALLAPLLVVRPRRLEIRRGHANGRQRRPEIVGDRREQRGLELLAAPRQLRRLPLLEKLRALDRNRRHAPERVERPGFDGPSGDRQ